MQTGKHLQNEIILGLNHMLFVVIFNSKYADAIYYLFYLESEGGGTGWLNLLLPHSAKALLRKKVSTTFTEN